MKLKPGVSLKGMRPETVVGMFISDGVHRRVTEYEMTVTSGTEGVHSPGSLHLVGLAFDSRTHYDDGTPWPEGMLEKLITELRAALGGMEFDVVNEDTHLHNEFQPKH